MRAIHFQFPGILGVHCLFSGRGATGGMSGNIAWHAGADNESAAAARAALLSLGAPFGLEGWAECQQAHGTDIVAEPLPAAPPFAPQPLPVADGMTQVCRGRGLLIKTADCQPLLLADATGKHIMALHVGWRGNRANFPAIAVKFFCQRYKLDPANLYAVQGPSLGPNHAEFINFSTEWSDQFLPWFNPENRCMNLWALTRSQLRNAGLADHHIFSMPICTYANHRDWFSHRRKHRGRQASLIWIEASGVRGH